MSEQNQMQWSIGAWLGTQLGGSVWMLVAGVLSLSFDAMAGSKVLAIFALANLIGWGLWRKRGQLSFHQTIQYLLLILGVSSLVTVLVLDKAGIYEAIQIGGRVSATGTYWMIAGTILALSAMFYFRFRR